MTRFRFIVLLVPTGWALGSTSKLWGTDGEEWKESGGAAGRLSDFSFAGYKYGNSQPPIRKTTVTTRCLSSESVDQTGCLQAAMDALEPGDGLLIPEGVYRLDSPLYLRTPKVTIRGAGVGKTILQPSQSLFEAHGVEGECKTGTSKGYSWCGGFFELESKTLDYTPLASIVEPAMRGATTLNIGFTYKLTVGMDVTIRMTDDDSHTMMSYLIGAGEPHPDRRAGKTNSFCARIESISGRNVEINRPLPFDIRPEWSPKLMRAGKTVQFVGLEDLTFEFPSFPSYYGHHQEWGYNAIDFSDTYNSWITRIQIINADMGIKIGASYQCELSEITFGPNTRQPDTELNRDGHHGIDLSFSSSLLLKNLNFIQTQFVHDITVQTSFLNVITSSSFTALSADHHGNAPSWNLWDNLRTDSLTFIYKSGGAEWALPNSGQNEVFWNVREISPADDSIKFISNLPQKLRERTGTWFGLIITPFASTGDDTSGFHSSYFLEKLDTLVEPVSLYDAQVQRRVSEYESRLNYYYSMPAATEEDGTANQYDYYLLETSSSVPISRWKQPNQFMTMAYYCYFMITATAEGLGMFFLA